MNRTLTLATAAMVLAGAAQASSIYLEDFTGDGAKGAFGSTDLGTVIDLGGVDWSVDVGDAVFVNGSDRFAVQDGAFEIQDTKATAALPTWLSPVIDADTYENIVFSADFFGAGSFEADGAGADDLIFQVFVDGGLVFEYDLFDTLPGFVGDGAVSTVISPVLSAGQIQIRVMGNTNDRGREELYFDNIALTGDAVVPVPLPATGLMLMAGLGALALRARRG